MRTWIRTGLLVAGLGLVTLLAGCPGMPGAGGGGGASSQTPPGVLPPPGLASGGVRSLVGATVTPPDNNILLVSYSVGETAEAKQWIATRRITITENALLLEGLNFDERIKGMAKDQNRLLALAKVTTLDWKYEPSANAPSTKVPAGGPGTKAPEGRGGAAPAPARGPARGR